MKMKSIPRAIYYLSPKTAINSFYELINKELEYTKVEEFEHEFGKFIGCPNIATTSHARVALYAILKSLKIEEGGEVIMSGINLPDMINMIQLNNLVPRLFDYEEKSFNFSIQDLKLKINSKTKVLFITVLAGMSSNLNEIIQIAKEYDLMIIIDQTQSMGMFLNGRSLASLVDYSIYSLCDLKDIHTHRGGVVAAISEESCSSVKVIINKISTKPNRKYFYKFIFEDLISSILLRRNFFHYGISPFLHILHFFNKANVLEDLTKGKGIRFWKINLGRGLWGGDGDLIRHEVPSDLLYKYTGLQARLGLKQLKKVHRIQRVRINFAKNVLSQLGDYNFVVNKSNEHLFWKFPIWTDEPKKIQKRFQLMGIDCAPTNLPSISTIEAFKNIIKDKTPNTDKLVKNILYIPVHYYLKEKEVKDIGKLINEVLSEK